MNTWQSDPAIPAPVREGLTHFCDQLRIAAGDALVSIILYGGLARGEYAPQSSDVNVMVVFKQVTVALLDAIAPVIEQARRDFDLSVMTLDESDIAVSAEVFPIKFRDIQRHHRLLHGQPVLAQMDITRERLQRQCVRELQNIQLRLRQLFLQRSRRPELLEDALEHQVSSFLHDLAVVVELRTGVVPVTKTATVEAAEKLGLKCQVLRDLLDLKRGELFPDVDDIRELYGDLMTVVDEAAKLAQAA